MADTEDRTPTPSSGGGPPQVEGGSAGVRAPGVSGPEELDHDVNIRAVVWSGVILAGITALSFVLMWWLFQGFLATLEARDPEPLPIREAAEPTLPPGPLLQTEPEEDLRRMREMEEALLGSYGLIRGEEGYARVPVEVALEMALEAGLGSGVRGVPSGAEIPDPGDGGMSANGESVGERGAGEAAAAGEGKPSPDDSETEGTPTPSDRSLESR